MKFETPEHYDNNGIQPLDIMREFMTPEAYSGFLVGNVVKYIMRYDKKNGADDVKKAAHYCEMLYDYITSIETHTITQKRQKEKSEKREIRETSISETTDDNSNDSSDSEKSNVGLF